MLLYLLVIHLKAQLSVYSTSLILDRLYLARLQPSFRWPLTPQVKDLELIYQFLLELLIRVLMRLVPLLRPQLLRRSPLYCELPL